MSFLFVKGHVELTVSEENERTCWGCGLCLLLPSNAPIFKCGWCGAITNQRTRKQKDKSLWWRRWRDRCFVSVVSLFMLFILGGGVWAVYPVVFSISYFCGIFHSLVTAILAIGNCVGATNHRHFIIFLISTLVSTMYVAIICSYAYAGWHIWPPPRFTSLACPYAFGNSSALRVVRELSLALLSSATLFSTRGVILVYLIVSSVSVQMGLTVLLWQQLCYIYEGETYLSHLSSGAGGRSGERDCQNLTRFFGCPYHFSRYLPINRSSWKRHRK